MEKHFPPVDHAPSPSLLEKEVWAFVVFSSGPPHASEPHEVGARVLQLQPLGG